MLPSGLFRSVYQSVPLVCVDLVVRGASGKVLLVQRMNEPAAGQWWFPGGRVLLGETRRDAARRKLAEEAGIEASPCEELGTEDVIFEPLFDAPRHGVTTAFLFEIADAVAVRLDAQSSASRWMLPGDWIRSQTLHPFVRKILESLPPSRCVA